MGCRARHRYDSDGARLATAPLQVIKIAASLVAVGSALICLRWVFQRRRIEDVNVLLGFRRRIWTLAAVAAVFATPALYLGLARDPRALERFTREAHAVAALRPEDAWETRPMRKRGNGSSGWTRILPLRRLAESRRTDSHGIIP